MMRSLVQALCSVTAKLGFLVDESHELRARLFLLELAGECRRGRNGMLLLYPSHDHAQMLRFDDHGHAERLQRALYAVADLVRQPLLHLQSAGEYVDDTRYLDRPTMWPFGM